MADHLAEHPAEAAAFADAQGISVDRIDAHLAALTPVVLRFDTAVTNHGFADGRAVPYQSVLQAGTAVLVDDSGVPQVRCLCGNPLEPPAARPDPEVEGDPWPGSSPDGAVVVEPSAALVPEFVLVDDATGEVAARPAGTDGGSDRPVAAAVADRARALGTAGPASPPGAGAPDVPPPAEPSGGTPGSPQEQPTGEAPAGEPPATGEEAPAPAGEAPGRAEQPTTGQPTTEQPPTEEPATEEPATDEPPPGEPTTEPPTQELPTDEPIAEESPQEAPPTAEEPTAREPTAREPTAEEPATPESSTRDTPAP
jgi:hypothetical protein